MNNVNHYTLLLFPIKTIEFDSINMWLEKHHEGQLELMGQESVLLQHSQSYTSCLNLKVQVKSGDESSLRTVVDDLSRFFECDYCLLASDFSLETVKLAVFDMDSTLIPMEVIDELAQEAGVKPEVAAITESAMRGDLDFNQSYEQRLALLKGMPMSAVEVVRAKLRFNLGVESFLTYLKANQADVAIASGGFIPFAQRLSEVIHFNDIRANHLEFEQAKLTGKVIAPIINAEHKAESLRAWRVSRQLPVNQCMAVGDGANDLLMLQEAGFGVAYKAKPFLRRHADCVIQYAEMDALKDVLEVVYRL